MTHKEKQVALDELVTALSLRDLGKRTLVGIAGPPGSGKSTFADALTAGLNKSGSCTAAVFPMDGYHYDDAVLQERGLLARKGAANTFDVAGFQQMLERLRRNDEPEIAVPVFDRQLELSRAGARLIPQSVDLLIVEGNYLLLDQSPWRDISPLLDVTVMLSVSEAVLQQRLIERWRTHNIPETEISSKVDANDLPNGRLVVSRSVAADFVART